MKPEITNEVKAKKRGGDNGKRKPIKDEDGVLWCNCITPKLVPAGHYGRGQAYCIKCGEYYYH